MEYFLSSLAFCFSWVSRISLNVIKYNDKRFVLVNQFDVHSKLSLYLKKKLFFKITIIKLEISVF